MGGGLIRSLGGWTEVFATRRWGEKQAFDQRILGDSEFVEEIQTGLEDLVKRNLRLSGQRIDQETLTQRVCKIYQASMSELRCGGRRRAVMEARRIMSRIGVRALGYTGTEVARYLGVSNSCVTRIAASDRKPDIGNLFENLSTASTNVPHMSRFSAYHAPSSSSRLERISSICSASARWALAVGWTIGPS